MPVAVRYTLLQLPELALVVVLLLVLAQWQWIGYGMVTLLAVLWALKDAALYPVYRHGLRDAPPVGAAALVGRSAIVLVALEPSGQVKVGGERWQALTADGGRVAEGAIVEIVRAEGLTLRVAATAGSPPAGPTAEP